MPSKRPHDRNDDEQEQQVEYGTSAKVTWIANYLHRSRSTPFAYHLQTGGHTDDSRAGLNEKRVPERDRLNQRLANANLLPRPARTIQRPMGEAGRNAITSNTSGERRNGFVLKEFLQRENDLSDEHYTMIQVCDSLSSLPGLISQAEHSAPSG